MQNDYIAPPVSPYEYPKHGGFPYLNLAKWYSIPYERVMNMDKTLPDGVYNEMKVIQNREFYRRQGKFGSMPYSV